jgi:glycylpeptide N-tetradecanoyltransferase
MKKNDAGKFWRTQPVIKEYTEDSQSKEVLQNDEIKTKEQFDFNETPYLLPNGFEWYNLDLKNDDIIQLQEFLNANYVESDHSKYIFNYSKELLQFALISPNYTQSLQLGVRLSKNKKLMGFISGTPCIINIRGKHIKMMDINFLCVHKSIRNKRLTPVLIKEILRRSIIHNYYKGVYTSGSKFALPITKTNYYHRYININNLYDCGFLSEYCKCDVKGDCEVCKKYKIQEIKDCNYKSTGFRKAIKSDTESIYEIYNDYMTSNFEMYKIMTLSEISHFFTNIDDNVYIYVSENDKNIQFVGGFYKLKMDINNSNKFLQFGFLWYILINKKNIDIDYENKLVDFINDIVKSAKYENVDFLSATNIQKNNIFLDKSNFISTANNLNFYLYNWETDYIDYNKQAFLVI